jgi:hypothetical protein
MGGKTPSHLLRRNRLGRFLLPWVLAELRVLVVLCVLPCPRLLRHAFPPTLRQYRTLNVGLSSGRVFRRS